MRSKITTQDIALVGIFSAITLLMGLTPLGFIPIGSMRITFMHVPTILAGFVGGPLVGAFVGLIFGLFSLFQNLTAPSSPLYFVFLSPLVSVLPRVFVGVGAHYLYRAFRRLHPNGAILLATALATTINTVGVLGMSGLLYSDRIYEVFKLPVWPLLGTIALTNLPWEILSATVISLAVMRTLFRKEK